MNNFKRANNALTHAQIVNEYEDKVRDLEREIERLNAYKEKVENVRYAFKIKIISLKKSLDKNPDKIKQAQLEVYLDIQEALK